MTATTSGSPATPTRPATSPTTTGTSAPRRPRSTGISRCWPTSPRSVRRGGGCGWPRRRLGSAPRRGLAGGCGGCPATLAGIATWLLLSRWVIPRLGRRLAVNRITVWTAGAVFVASWLPFNNGLRPEPLIAFGAVLTWVLVEYAIGTRRLWPAAAAIVVMLFSVTTAPQGITALAPLLVGARAIVGIIRSRRAEGGLLAPIAA